MKRALFIGRWQPLHPGHKWLFNQKLEQEFLFLLQFVILPSTRVILLQEDVISNLEKEYSDEIKAGLVKVIPIQILKVLTMVEAIEISEFVPPKDIDISATEIGKLKIIFCIYNLILFQDHNQL